ncbi:hypothetical protein JW926_09935 [Candidatus Sumerlaeota bacterium]|nr:hypothetical protein [Candidatus Sumerlaeota bacterium]
MKPTITEYLVISMYLIFMLLTGLAFRRLIRNFSDYFRSGCRATWWLVGASVFMSAFSAWTFTGAAGVAYASGISVAIIFLANSFGYLVNFLFTAPYFRRMRAITFPEVIRQRFDTQTQQFYVWVGVIPGILTAGLTLLGVAIFTSAVFGFNLQITIVVLGMVVLMYSTIGGKWSVMATDFIQTLILMPMALLVSYLSLRYIGGFSELIAEIKRQNLPDLIHFVDRAPKSQFTSGWIVAMFCYVFISYNSMGASSKFYACKDERGARKAAALAFFLMLFGSFIWFIPPIVARLKFSAIVNAQALTKPAESAFAVISMHLLPKGLSGLIVVAMFSATMSSLDTMLNGHAAIISQDVYIPYFRPKASQREIFIVGEIASIVVGFLIISSALYFSTQKDNSLFEYMMKFGSLLGTPMIVPMFMAFFIKKAPRWSAVFSICCAFVFSYLSYRNEWSYEKTVFTNLTAGVVSFLLTTFFWKFSSAEYPKKVEAFYRKLRTPVDFEKEVGKPNDALQLKIVGYVVFSISAFIFLLLLVPNPLSGRLQILFIGCVILFLSFVMMAAAHSAKKGNQPNGCKTNENHDSES